MATETLSFNIPKTYKALVYDNPGEISTALEELPIPTPGPGECLVRLTHTGVCHSDLSIMRNGWKLLPFPTPKGQIGGHEGVGIVQQLGPGTENAGVKLGDRVGIKWNAASCGTCYPCRSGCDGHCVLSKFSGYFTPGTFAQYALAQASYVTPIPANLDSAHAAPMLCAGLTSYAALRKCDAKSGSWIIVSGAGGGLGHLAIQIGARGMAYRMIGIDHPSKESLVMECGAEAFIDVTKFSDTSSPSLADEIKRITGGELARAVVVCAGVNAAYTQAVGMVGFNGTVVCVGLPEGAPTPIPHAIPGVLCARQKKIVGSSIGSQMEAVEVLELAARGVVKTKVRVVAMGDKGGKVLDDVFKEMAEGKAEGRVVIDLR